MIITKINEIEFTYNDELCYEQVDGKSMEFLNRQIIFKLACKCDREKEEQAKQREKFLEQERIRQNCFISKTQHHYRFKHCDKNTDKELLRKAMNYANHFEEMKKENTGLLLYGNVGSEKTYLACSIDNEIITKYSYVVKVRNFAQILNDLQKGALI